MVLTITGKNTRTAAIIVFDSWLSTPNQLLKIGAKAMIGTEFAAIANGSSEPRRTANRAAAIGQLLDVLELADEDKVSGRATARVRLAIAPLGNPPADRLRALLTEALERAPVPHAVVRRYRSEPSPLVRDMNGSWRTGKLDAVLRGDFDLIAASQAHG